MAKTAAKESAAKKTGTKKTAAKKSATKTPTAGKAATKRQPAKTASAPKSTRKYSPAAGAQVAEDLHEMHKGKLHIGKSDKLVTNPKQAIAIGLAQARRAGKKVPPNPNETK